MAAALLSLALGLVIVVILILLVVFWGKLSTTQKILGIGVELILSAVLGFSIYAVNK